MNCTFLKKFTVFKPRIPSYFNEVHQLTIFRNIFQHICFSNGNLILSVTLHLCSISSIFTRISCTIKRRFWLSLNKSNIQLAIIQPRRQIPPMINLHADIKITNLTVRDNIGHCVEDDTSSNLGLLRFG